MLATFAVALLGMLTPFSIYTPAKPETAIELEAASDPRLREELWLLLRDAFYGHAKLEQAAFVVRNSEGELSLVRWPSSGTPHKSQWLGSFPRGAIAIAHTHPNGFPEPSRVDKQTAKLRRMPVYVLTRLKITKTTGGASITVVRGDWNPAVTRAMR